MKTTDRNSSCYGFYYKLVGARYMTGIYTICQNSLFRMSVTLSWNPQPPNHNPQDAPFIQYPFTFSKNLLTFLPIIRDHSVLVTVSVDKVYRRPARPKRRTNFYQHRRPTQTINAHAYILLCPHSILFTYTGRPKIISNEKLLATKN